MWHILKKESNSFLTSLGGYITLTIFLLMMGLFTWTFPQSSILEGGFSNLDPLFNYAPYILMFLAPAITMRAFAEERKAGTMELLLTKPLSDWEIILGKYLSGVWIIFIAILPTTIYYYSVWQLGAPEGNIDTASVIGSYIGLIFLGAVFTAIGILSSALTTSQIVSFILAIFICFALYDGIDSLTQINVWSDYSYMISQWGISFHYDTISKGLIDSRNILFFVSVIGIFLSLTKLVLSSRKW